MVSFIQTAHFRVLQDLDVVKFIIHALTNYFPSLLAYILLFEMPMLLSGTDAPVYASNLNFKR